MRFQFTLQDPCLKNSCYRDEKNPLDQSSHMILLKAIFDIDNRERNKIIQRTIPC